MSKRTQQQPFNPFMDAPGQHPKSECEHATARSVSDFSLQTRESERIAREHRQTFWGQPRVQFLPELQAEGSVLSNPRHKNRARFSR